MSRCMKESGELIIWNNFYGYETSLVCLCPINCDNQNRLRIEALFAILKQRLGPSLNFSHDVHVACSYFLNAFISHGLKLGWCSLLFEKDGAIVMEDQSTRAMNHPGETWVGILLLVILDIPESPRKSSRYFLDHFDYSKPVFEKVDGFILWCWHRNGCCDSETNQLWTWVHSSTGSEIFSIRCHVLREMLSFCPCFAPSYPSSSCLFSSMSMSMFPFQWIVFESVRLSAVPGL